ncbi:CPBP family intramembrane glutamic endopeptidase [Candidatus Xianfuyuplasma coldseepsis]|uniref:CPBP family intramembrane metalloprotease n=1 Tax=Candidatus Xianfuyuplasma coldseepsis TaxID=2782163 RepID=A0A7L7KSF8_9MOLU|nr:type II CAAX endopeptidase family protein [Xianfuyuplasma coldseepsis]QMS85673.1 CPBP family intramembrane metalloprotease [Xianfuyuplasma coldseepsis]
MIEQKGKFLIPIIYVSTLVLSVFIFFGLRLILSSILLDDSILQLAFYLPVYLLLILLFVPAWRNSLIHAVKQSRKTLQYTLYGVLLMFLAMVVIGIVYQLIGINDTSENQAFLDSLALNGSIYDKINLAVFAIVLAPLVEEMVFRNALFQILRTNNMLPINVVITISAFTFGLMHTGFSDLVQVFYYAGLGAILGYIYYRSETIVTPILVHMLYNTYGVIVMLITLG